MHRLLAVSLLACQAQQPSDLGPSFGGDPGFAAAARSLDNGTLPEPGTLSEAGLLAGRPLAVGDGTCAARACIAARSAWMDGDLAVAVGIDGVPVRPPVDLAFVLDVSCSTADAADVRATPVEIALDHLRADDQLAIWAFTGTPVPLLELGPPDPDEARRVLDALDHVQALAGILADVPFQVDDLDTLIAFFEGTDDTGLIAHGFHDEPIEPTDEAALDVLYNLDALVQASENHLLEPGLIALASLSGSAIDEAASAALQALPDGTPERASRMVFVSDFDGASPLDPIQTAAERFVGTSVLGVTQATGRTMVELARTPGAHTFDASDPSLALASWEQRFDSLVAPNAWGLEIALDPVSESDWSLVRRFGTTDVDQRGANAFFASHGHASLGLVLKPTRADPAQPRFVLTLTTEAGEERIGTFARVPVKLLDLPWGQGDDEVGLELARSIRLFDAVQSGDESALELWAANAACCDRRSVR